MSTIQCSTFADYIQHMKECLHYPTSNEIWCSLNDRPEDFPCLSILTKGEEAVVNYFSENNAQTYVSIGDMRKNGSIEFENGQYEIAAYQVISLSSALQCALQFFSSQERPSCIEWDEL